jgi:hypothetical protein
VPPVPGLGQITPMRLLMTTPFDAFGASPPEPEDVAAPAMPDGRRRLSIAETADYLGIKPRTLRTYIGNDTVPYRQLGGGYFFLWPDDINRILDQSLKGKK